MEFLLSLLFIFLIIVLSILGIGFYLLSKLFGGAENAWNMIRKFIGWKRGASASESRGSSENSNDGFQSGSSSNSKSSSSERKNNNGKMFDSNEGTYVDFEEVKQ